MTVPLIGVGVIVVGSLLMLMDLRFYTLALRGAGLDDLLARKYNKHWPGSGFYLWWKYRNKKENES